MSKFINPKYLNWNEYHSQIISSLCLRFKEENLRYFILRNYEGLPMSNKSKDVDIVVEPKRVGIARGILKSVYKINGLSNFHEVKYGNVYCCHGMDINKKMGIHIDIIGSYVSKGSEIFTFEELYIHTEDYRGLRVLNKYFEGVMIFIYKQFNYKPILKKEYQEIIYNTHKDFPQFKVLISKLTGNELAEKIFNQIENKDFDKMLRHSRDLTRALKKYALKKSFFKTIKYTFAFYIDKLNRIVFRYRKYSKVFSVIAPDGAGKTTFIDVLIETINHYYVNDKNDNRCMVYHFRPNIFPNLGELGEKVGLKEQDKNFINPHRAKPANRLNSLVRLAYYWLDYIIGFNFLVRRDVQFDRFSVFDRYSYDLLVDPARTRLNLPMWLRKIFVKFMPHPKLVFFLDAPAEVIFKRKQELTLNEISRQNKLYKEVVSSNKRFISLNSNRPVNEIVDEAIKIILKTFTQKL